MNNFAGGLGTEQSPYLLKTGEQAYKMGKGSGYFKLMEDVIVTNEIYLSGKKITLDILIGNDLLVDQLNKETERLQNEIKLIEKRKLDLLNK